MERIGVSPHAEFVEPCRIYYSASAVVVEEGDLLVPADEFLRIAEGIETESVQLESGDCNLIVTTNSQSTRFPSIRRAYDPESLRMEAVLKDVSLTAGESFKVNQLALREGLRKHAELPKASDRSVNPFLFFRDGELCIGKYPISSEERDASSYVCKPSTFPRMSSDFELSIPPSISDILIRLLGHDVDVTLAKYEVHVMAMYDIAQCSIFFQNPGEPEFYFWWRIS
jgi:hypothetical protein